MQHILIVDDHFGIRVLLEQRLQELGFKVETCSSGKEALLKLLSSRPELILMDIKMPEMGGIEALRLITRFCPEIPVIMMSAYSETDEVREAREKGNFVYYVEKPFYLNEVTDLIKKILKTKNSPET